MHISWESEINTLGELTSQLAQQDNNVWTTKDLLGTLDIEFKELQFGDRIYYFHPEIEEVADIIADYTYLLSSSENHFAKEWDRELFEKNLHATVQSLLTYSHALKLHDVTVEEFEINNSPYRSKNESYSTWIDVEFQKWDYSGLLAITTKNWVQKMWCVIKDHGSGEFLVDKENITDFTKIDEDILRWLVKMFGTQSG